MTKKKTYIVKEIENGYLLHESLLANYYPEKIWIGADLEDIYQILCELRDEEKEKE